MWRDPYLEKPKTFLAAEVEGTVQSDKNPNEVTSNCRVCRSFGKKTPWTIDNFLCFCSA